MLQDVLTSMAWFFVGIPVVGTIVVGLFCSSYVKYSNVSDSLPLNPSVLQYLSVARRIFVIILTFIFDIFLSVITLILSIKSLHWIK